MTVPSRLYQSHAPKDQRKKTSNTNGVLFFPWKVHINKYAQTTNIATVYRQNFGLVLASLVYIKHEDIRNVNFTKQGTDETYSFT